MKELTHLSLFSGIGGIDLAAEWAGFRTVLFVEIDDYCQKVLKKHWPDVPIIGDIRDATKERIMAYTQSCREGRGQSEDRARQRIEQRSEGAEGSIESSDYNPITLITGGFPCQPVSVAGQRRGKEDDRWLWPEMLRVISDVKPTWVVAENVAGLLRMGFNDCVSDLESESYETIPFLIPACAVNAPHRRDRIFIVAYYDASRCNDGRLSREGIQRRCESRSKARASREALVNPNGNGFSRHTTTQEAKSIGGAEATIEPGSGDVADSSSKGLQKPALAKFRQLSSQAESFPGGQFGRGNAKARGNWEVEPELGRVAYGISHRVDRLKCLGNAVVPQQIYPILKAIADIERLT